MSTTESSNDKPVHFRTSKPKTPKRVRKAYPFDARIAAIHKLRINAKSLAAEARYIRKEELRCGLAYYWMLHWHRISKLREESRYTQLALAYVRRRKYATVEQSKKPVDVARLTRKITQHIDTTTMNNIVDWINGTPEASTPIC